MGFVRRMASAQERNPQSILHTLRDYCRSDATCCKLYYLEGCGEQSSRARGEIENYDELQMLSYLTPWLDKDFPLTQLLDESGACGSPPAENSSHLSAIAHRSEESAEEGMLRRAWVNEMKLQAYERGQVRCAQNQKFIFSPEEAEGKCVCESSNDDCHAVFRRQSLSPWTWSTSALIVSAVSVTVLVVLKIYTLAYAIPIFRKLYANLTSRRRQQQQSPSAAARVTEAATKKFVKTVVSSQHKKSS